MNKREVSAIIKRINSGKATGADEEKLKYWLHTLNEENPTQLGHNQLDDAVNEVWQKLQPAYQMPRRRVLHWWPSVAASVLIAATIGTYFYMRPSAVENKHNQISQIAPQVNHNAVLTLANGEKIVLNEAARSKLASQTDITVKADNGGMLIYSIGKGNNNGPVTFNTIETPAGSQYQINLADGSKVWLNAASKLRFPTKFNGKERVVELSGEGYFEVAHNKEKPFKVISKQQELSVLGTHFNVTAYDDEDLVKTVLLSGSVKVNARNDFGNSRLLKPGQQSVLETNSFTLSAVDTTDAIAWKYGLFRLNNEKLENVMRKVARWYDVEVVFDDKQLRSETFNGVVHRVTQKKDFFKILEDVGQAKFKLTGNVVHIARKNQ